jgi:hypothetical protein
MGLSPQSLVEFNNAKPTLGKVESAPQFGQFCEKDDSHLAAFCPNEITYLSMLLSGALP